MVDGWYYPDMPQKVDYIPRKVMEDVCFADVGEMHTMCITKNKELWGWGKNNCGQLGVGDFEERKAPVLVMKDVRSVVATERQTYAIKTDGSLWGWGDSTEDRVLLDAPKICTTPTHLMDHVKEVSARCDAVVCVKEDNTLWAWGGPESMYIFGDRTCMRRRGPELLLHGIASVAMPKAEPCSCWCLAITLTGDLYSLGGSVGHVGSLVSIIPKASPYKDVFPVKIMESVAAVKCGNCFSLIQLTDGRLFGGGENSLGQCGDGESSGTRYKPVPIMTHVVEAAAGWNYGVALQENGDVWIWGGDYSEDRRTGNG